VRFDDVKRAEPYAAKMVFARRDDLKMVRVHAGWGAAQMVDVPPVWNVPPTAHNRNTMR
jgi:hypothetical protein